MKRCTRCGEQQPPEAFNRGQAYCRACQAAYHREWRAANHERHLANGKAWREANVEHRREYGKAWWAANPDKKKAYSAQWREANRESLRERAKDRYAAMPEKYLANNAKRRARKNDVEHQPYTRREIYARDGGRCRICDVEVEDKPRGFHIDHIVPISLGGPDIPANLQLACPTCNLGKKANLEGQIHLPVG